MNQDKAINAKKTCHKLTMHLLKPPMIMVKSGDSIASCALG